MENCSYLYSTYSKINFVFIFHLISSTILFLHLITLTWHIKFSRNFCDKKKCSIAAYFATLSWLWSFSSVSVFPFRFSVTRVTGEARERGKNRSRTFVSTPMNRLPAVLEAWGMRSTGRTGFPVRRPCFPRESQYPDIASLDRVPNGIRFSLYQDYALISNSQQASVREIRIFLIL